MARVVLETSIEVAFEGKGMTFWRRVSTIGSLKALIKEKFSLAEHQLQSNVLVPDNRVFIGIPSNPENLFEISNFLYLKKKSLPNPVNLVNARDLLDLQLEEGTPLVNLNVKGGDKLRFGWKEPFTIYLWKTTQEERISRPRPITVSCYDTVAELKRKIEVTTGEPVTEDNLPQVFFSSNDVDNQTLLSFGFYSRYSSGVGGWYFNIYLNRYNSPCYYGSIIDIINVSPPAAEAPISIEVVDFGYDRNSACLFWSTADTIRSLKDQIKRRLHLNDFNQRLLVTGNFTDVPTPNAACDLLELEEGTPLLNVGLKDGDRLVFGWKLPFFIQLSTVSGFERKPSIFSSGITVTCYDTVSELKRKIQEKMGEPVTEDNLPQVFFSSSNDVDNKTLLSFGLYSHHARGGDAFGIYRNRYNSGSYGLIQASRPCY